VPGQGASVAIVVAPGFLLAHGTDALHVAQHERLGAGESGFVEAEHIQQFWQLVDGMRSLADEPVEIRRRHAKVLRDVGEFTAAEVVDFAHRAPLLEPVPEHIDSFLDDRIWFDLV
jgi:hypothetical protein